ncbi:MAG: HAD-IC family P-type ATPase, partial [Bacteroidota bacterium]
MLGTRTVTYNALRVGLVFFLLANRLVGVSLQESFLFSLGMIVAFVPEGLLPTVTLALAMAVQRMAKRQALVKRLSSIETLGSTTVICTDKTGTLTENQMTVQEVWLNRGYAVSGTGYEPVGKIEGASEVDLHPLLQAACLCNNARLIPPSAENPRWSATGDPTEAALLVLAMKGGLEPKDLNRLAPRLFELPFSPQRKRMTTLNLLDGSFVAHVKGAPLELLARCTSIWVDGKTRPLDEGMRQSIRDANDQIARSGLRIIALARRIFSSRPPHDAEEIEKDLTFLGFAAMFDPPRAGVAEAVEKCHR